MLTVSFQMLQVLVSCSHFVAAKANLQTYEEWSLMLIIASDDVPDVNSQLRSKYAHSLHRNRFLAVDQEKMSMLLLFLFLALRRMSPVA